MVGTQRMPTSRPGRDRIRSAVQNLVPVEGTLSLLTENFPKPHIQVIEGAGAIIRAARAVHHGEGFVVNYSRRHVEPCGLGGGEWPFNDESS